MAKEIKPKEKYPVKNVTGVLVETVVGLSAPFNDGDVSHISYAINENIEKNVSLGWVFKEVQTHQILKQGEFLRYEAFIIYNR